MSVISTEDFINKYSHVNFQKIARTCSCPRVRERLLGIYNLMIGKNRIEAAAAVGRNPEWLRSWVLRYDKGGYDNLFDRPRPGQQKYLTNEQDEELVADILKMQDERNGGRITGKDISKHIQIKYDVTYKGTAIYDLLERLGLSWVSSRSKHPSADFERQNRFKQTFKARARKISKKRKGR